MKFICIAIISTAFFFSCNSTPSSDKKNTVNRDSITAAIEATAQSAIDSVKAAVDADSNGEKPKPEALKPSSKSSLYIDSAEAKALVKKFRKKEDEFEKITWYIPKSAPNYVNYNSVHCYFNVSNGVASTLRFKIQYRDDDWLFINNINFLIDGQTYRFIPSKVNRDNGDGAIWEWIDTYVSDDARTVVLALCTAKSAKMKLNGNDYYDTRSITAAQLKSIKETLQLYLFMGGTI